MYQKTLSEIVTSIINNIYDVLPEADTSEGEVLRDVFIDPISDKIAEVYGDMKLMEIAQSVTTASGDDLDKLAANYFVFRKSSTLSYGKIRFYIKNTNKTTLIDSELPTEILIPKGYIISTTGSLVSDSIDFETTESGYVTRDTIKTSLPTDSSNGYKYIELNISSSAGGSSMNIKTGEITLLSSSDLSGIISVSNPFSTTGGTDYEEDSSLKIRIMLAISGSNIGTKDGYLSYVLKQSNVEDSIVIGAGDSIMFRDGGYIDYSKKYHNGQGGMVDIWVKGQLNKEQTFYYTLTSQYINDGAADIIFPKQPVNSIVSIISTSSSTAFKNAADYKIEQGTEKSIDDYRYYKDIIWDFSITDSFPDSNLIAVDVVDSTELEILKELTDSELKIALNYMSNMDYSINWNLVEYENINNITPKPMFQKVYYNGKVYKIIAVDNRLNGRTFIKNNDSIYLRYYDNPDYSLAKDKYIQQAKSVIGTDVGNSYKAKDGIHWLNKDILSVGDKIKITYNYDQLVNDLQTGIESKRVLTADVLLRQAYKIPLQVILNAVCNSTVSSDTVRKTIINRITVFISSLKKMGATFEESEIVAIARQTDGVESVDLDSVSISIVGYGAQKSLSCSNNEYFEISNINVSVTSTDTVTN